MSAKISTGEGSIPLGENASGQVSICFFACVLRVNLRDSHRFLCITRTQIRRNYGENQVFLDIRMISTYTQRQSDIYVYAVQNLFQKKTQTTLDTTHDNCLPFLQSNCFTQK